MKIHNLNRQKPVDFDRENTKAQPFIKWAGGKRSLTAHISKLLPHQFKDYWEPFVGGGAVYFALEHQIERAHLSDANGELIITYRMIQSHVEEVISKLQVHSKNHCKEYYMNERSLQPRERDPLAIAARFIYLNKTCYNGLYRVNRRGEFNVPMGDYKHPVICDETNLRAASETLDGASIKQRDFANISPRSGDVVYCDPPYHKTFSGYTGHGFTNDHHKTLRDKCLRWRDSGVHVIITNSNTSMIRELYSKSFFIHEISGPRTINRNGDGRDSVKDLLIIAK